MLFLGEYEHVIDAKQRLAIPAEVRDVFNPEQHGSAFIAAPGSENTLLLWPERTFQAIARELQGSMLGDRDLGAYERRIFSQSARVPMDSAGRVRIPERLLKEHGLSGKAMVLGVGDHLEVVAPEQWNRDREQLEPVRSDIWNRARLNAAANQRNGRES